MIHLVDQIFVLGPLYMHYMYLYEHHMVVMKGYVRNHAHPEGSMIEGYTTEEVNQVQHRLHQRWKTNRHSSFTTPW
jgi:hypothetical protein